MTLSNDASFSEEYLVQRMSRKAKQPQKIIYDFTRDAGLLHQYYTLREEMFFSVWGLDHSSGAKDAFDDKSQIMIASRGLHCIAGGRITISTPSQRQSLPMEKDGIRLAALFPELYLDQCAYAEFSRFAMLSDMDSNVVFPEMIRRFIRRCVAEKATYAFAAMPAPLTHQYRQAMQLFGLKCDVRSDVMLSANEENSLILSVVDLAPLSRAKKTIDESVNAPFLEAVLAD